MNANPPNHSAGTEFRQRFGIEVARALLGHRSAVVTERYAEMDRTLAQTAMSQIG